jgi:hypothetical protein
MSEPGKILTVRQIAKQVGVDPQSLLDTLQGPRYNFKIPSVDTQLGAFITNTILEEYKKNGTFKTVPAPSPQGEDRSRREKKIALNPKFASGEEFENAVGRFIHQELPNSHLSNVFLFLAERLATTDRYGREIDHLLHLRRGSQHRLVIVECKHSNLELEGRSSILQEKSWIVETSAGRKEVREQMWLQARALLQLLKPIPEVELVIEAIALLSDERCESIQDTRGQDDPRIQYRVMGFHDLEKYLKEMSQTHEFFRVGQSEFLRRLRQGMRCDQLGHPDIRDAIDYHRRSRQTLDYGLFKHFNPTKGKWAINGTAGMGKSVLLAYALCAFSTDYKLVLQKNGSLKLVAANLNEKELPALQDRKITVFAIKEKQRRIIEYFFRYFIDDFQTHDESNVLRIQRPTIRQWQLGEDISGNVVLIDEAHDLSDEAQNKIAAWLNADPQNRYLVIACDRHQKLRLIGDSDHKRMIAGLHFGGHTKALKRVYRNPFSVYGAGLGLMFRWFAPEGPQVVPDQAQLRDDFGFKVNRRSDEKGGICEFEMVEDAHPGNHWHHCVSNFPDADTAHRWLGQHHLCQDEVLWVRFQEEDPDFDYERLQPYQYHNLNTAESANLIDKYIKGQEFPVVVIEGVGVHFNNFEDEEAMFAHRRELYLCASRATVFLFFIYSGAQGGLEPVSQELENLRKQLSLPLKESRSSQRWGLYFTLNRNSIPLSQFEDLIDPLEVAASDDESEEAVENGGDTAPVAVVSPEAPISDDIIHVVETVESQKAENPLKIDQDAREPQAEDEPTLEVTIEQKPTTNFPRTVRKLIGKSVNEGQLQKRKDGRLYTPIDVYTAEILAHYLNVEKSTVSTLFKKCEQPIPGGVRIPCVMVKEITEALKIPEPWRHPRFSEKLNRVLVKFKGEPLTYQNVSEKISDFYAKDGVTLQKAKRATLGALGQARVTSPDIVNFLDFAKIIKTLKVDGDDALNRMEPHVVEDAKIEKSVPELPNNPNGHSVLDAYTPRKLADYFDVSPLRL